MDNNYILVKTICHHYEISEKMVEQLHEFDFIQFYKENDEEYMDGLQLSKLEQILNLHNDLGVNFEGIDVAFHLIEKIQEMELEINSLKNQLLAFDRDGGEELDFTQMI